MPCVSANALFYVLFVEQQLPSSYLETPEGFRKFSTNFINCAQASVPVEVYSCLKAKLIKSNFSGSARDRIKEVISTNVLLLSEPRAKQLTSIHKNLRGVCIFKI